MLLISVVTDRCLFAPVAVKSGGAALVPALRLSGSAAALDSITGTDVVVISVDGEKKQFHKLNECGESRETHQSHPTSSKPAATPAGGRVIYPHFHCNIFNGKNKLPVSELDSKIKTKKR